MKIYDGTQRLRELFAEEGSYKIDDQDEIYIRRNGKWVEPSVVEMVEVRRYAMQEKMRETITQAVVNGATTDEVNQLLVSMVSKVVTGGTDDE